MPNPPTGGDSARRTRPVVGLLGPVSVAPGAGVFTEISGLRAKRLLAALALGDGRYVSAERLADAVWGDEPPRAVAAALHTQVSRLRQSLAAAGPDATVESGAAGYRLTGCDTDLSLAESEADTADPARVAVARARWRGTPGDDLGDEPDGVAAQVRRRAAALAARLDDLELTAALRRGDYGAARRIAESRCAADPLDETAHIALMHALHGEHRTAEALAVFARLRRTLRRELGAAPGPEAVALNARLLAESDGTATTPAADRPGPHTPAEPIAVGLRASPTDLIGRSDDIDAVLDLLAAHRVVTVQGPGGVGKTRIAHSVGTVLAERRRSLYFVPLAPVTDPAGVAGAVAAVLGVGESDLSAPGRPRLAVGPLAARLAAALRDRAVVLVLDNCEHVIDSAAALVAELVAAAPALTVLATSRGPLMVPGERIYPLPVLAADGPASPAVRLFTLRAQSIRPGATLDGQAVAELCSALDGLPLAIELAAARMRTMTVAEIAAGLGARFALLRTNDRTTEPRHRTLFAVIDWSWELLDDGARRALRRLCRFPGGFTADAAAAVLTDPERVPAPSGFLPDVHDALTALVDQSLLEVTEAGGHTRYRMLETVREYGAERLSAAGEADDVEAAMAAWGRSVARRARALFDSDDRSGLIDLVSSEGENLQWVLLRAIESGDRDTLVAVFPVMSAFWAARGLRAEAGTWGERILDALGTPPTGLSETDRLAWQATVLACASQIIGERRIRAVARARLLLRRLHRPELATSEVTDLLTALGLQRSLSGVFRILLAGTRSQNRDVAIAAISLRLNLRENAGNIDGALRDAAALHAPTLSDPWTRAMTRSNEAGLYGQRGYWAEALPLYRAAASDLDGIGAAAETTQIHSYVVTTLAALGDVAGARRELAEAEALFPAAGPGTAVDPETLTNLLIARADLAAASGEDPLPALREAVHRLTPEKPALISDPGLMMLVSSVACGLVLAGDHAAAERLLPILGSAVTEAVSITGWFDLPQAGTAALAAGLVLGSAPDHTPGDDRPARLALLGMRLGARRDNFVLAHARDAARSRSGLTDDAWECLARRAARMPRRQAAEEILAILASAGIGGNRA
ncbi:BTAD domain-containing putative transcriptional regulator [Tsukamurella soli]|uniref:BTAD domain-containing putative transcriptional regulator n=1 Tax=Tsukamurella soli TaxID=644556 RepID=A0ABP8JN63_9ACTN